MKESGSRSLLVRVPSLTLGDPAIKDPTWLIDNTIAYRQPCAAQKFLELCRGPELERARLRLRVRLDLH